jgi:endonuclease/exonuclease/phosphatase family metal-dependent hydrolase
MQLKVLCWNIWIDGNFDQIASFLKQSNADIIGLQEVLADDPKREVIKYLESLGYRHVFAPLKQVWGGKTWNNGPAIFSKLPIHSSEIYMLSKENGRAAVRADIKIGDKVLHVFNTHLVHTHQEPSDLQNEQVDQLIKILPNEHTLVMGDFNAAPDSVVVQQMSSVMVDVDPLNSPTWSLYEEGCSVCKVNEIKIRLDYIFTTPDIKTSSYKVESSKASDHVPVSVNIEL